MNLFLSIKMCYLLHLIILGLFAQWYSKSAKADNITVKSEMPKMSEEKRLINHLLVNYNLVGRSGRPVMNGSTVVLVKFGLGLIQLDLDEKSKVLTLSIWIRYQWKDEYLTWIPDDYGGVQTIRLEPRVIWRPDIMLYNTAEVDAESREALAVVDYNGVVNWFPHTILKSSCSVEVTNFPFDTQQCHMWFGSWTYSSAHIDLQMSFPGGIDLSTFLSDYRESCAWEIINVTGKREVKPPDEPTSFVVLVFDIHLKRKIVFSSYILTLPCVFLACLTLVVFWLPPERPDRTSLAMSTFSSFMLLLLILVEAAPPTASSIPTLGVYYCFNMVIIMLAIILSSLVVNITRLSPHQVPKWLGRLAAMRISQIICPPRRSRSRYQTHSYEQNSLKDTSTMIRRQDAGLYNHFEYDTRQRDEGTILSYDNQFSIHRQENKSRKQLDDIEEAIQAFEHSENLQRITTVLDRMFFVIYFLLILISLCVFFPRPQ